MAAKASEALGLRGQIYSFSKDGVKAEADYNAALKLAPQDAAVWIGLADNYTNNLSDDEQALAAYRQAFAITATVSMARILTDQAKPDEALETLKPYADLNAVVPVWRIKLLRAYGHVFAAQGKKRNRSPASAKPCSLRLRNRHFQTA